MSRDYANRKPNNNNNTLQNGQSIQKKKRISTPLLYAPRRIHPLDMKPDHGENTTNALYIQPTGFSNCRDLHQKLDIENYYNDHWMIAQLKQSLERNARFENRNSEKAIAETSLKDRLSALKDSANLWQQRAPPTNRRVSAGILKEVKQELVAEPVKPSRSSDISSGLTRFFAPNSSSTKTCVYDSNDIDLDAISVPKTRIFTPPSRPRAPNRRKGCGSSSTTDNRIQLDRVELDESILEEDDENEAEKLETQAQAIAAIQSAKQQLRNTSDKSKHSLYPEVMLVQIRGAKHVDVRLVAPMMSSIHESACFVIVHRKHLIKYEGEKANILEKTKAAQMCIEILGKSDLGCSAESIVTVNESQRSSLSRFLVSSENGSELNNNKKMDDMGSIRSPVEPFEITICSKLNLVFRIADDRTANTCSRRERVSYRILDPDDALIFDFASEIYVWIGRNAGKIKAAYAMEYAKQLRAKSIQNCRLLIGETGEDQGRRPDWILFRKIHQGVLDTLFKAKFHDWPENEIMTTCRPRPLFSPKKMDSKVYENGKPSGTDHEAEDLANRILSEASERSEPMMILEDQEIDRTMRDIVTESLNSWFLNAEILEKCDESIRNVLDSNRCYVFRWQYRIQKSGIRRIKTGKEEERETGRSRIAFFYWLGEHTTPKHHGLCALRIKDLDKDNSPRIRVAHGNEPALFMALFGGKLVIRSNSTNGKRRFVVRGASITESCIQEIEDLDAKLRSHAVYLEEDWKNWRIICGANCNREQVKMALVHACSSSEEPKVEVEGDEKDRKWIHSTGRQHDIKIWRMYDMEADRIHHLGAHSDCAFTFDQMILTGTMMIDVGGALWIWCQDVITTFVLKVASKYWKDRKGTARIVYKGFEPEEFRALFLKWVPFEMETNEMAARDLKELLAERCRNFTVAELRERTNLPAGMDLRRLETYLTDEDFGKTFGMSRDEFYGMKSWKQNDARKRVGLF